MFASRVVRVVLLASLVGCGGGSSTNPVPPANTGVFLTFASQASPGDTVAFEISFASGDKQGDPVILRLSYDGGQPATDTSQVPPPGYDLEGDIMLPANIPPGTLTLTVVLPVEGDSASASLTIVPRPPPPPPPPPPPAPSTITAILVPPASPAVFATFPNVPSLLLAGIASTLSVQAADSDGLAWVGWELGPPANVRDSVAASGASDSVGFPVTVPSSFVGAPLTVKAFLRTSAGTLHDTTLAIAGVGQYVDHPVTTAALADTLKDVVYDTKRNVLYLSEAGQSSIAVLSLATMTYGAPIALPAQPWGIDLTPGNDTLVVALANTADLAFVDLTSASYAVTTTHIATFDGSPPDSTHPFNTVVYPRVAADGTVMLVLGNNTGGVGSFNLTTSAGAFYGSGANPTRPARSRDGSFIFLPDVEDCLISAYSTAAHAFATDPDTCGGYEGESASVSANGAYFTYGASLFASVPAMPSQRFYLGFINTAAPLLGFDGVTLSDDATAVYLASRTECGPTACPATVPAFYLRFGLSAAGVNQPLTQTFTEVVDAPEAPGILLPTPDGHTLIGIGPTKVMAFDLTQSSTPAAMRVARAHRPPRPVAVVRRPLPRNPSIRVLDVRPIRHRG
jgi:hypothetical protein